MLVVVVVLHREVHTEASGSLHFPPRFYAGYTRNTIIEYTVAVISGLVVVVVAVFVLAVLIVIGVVVVADCDVIVVVVVAVFVLAVLVVPL